jgi:hypothetical protein
VNKYPDWYEPMGESQVHPHDRDGTHPHIIDDSSGRRNRRFSGLGWLNQGMTDEDIEAEKKESEQWFKDHGCGTTPEEIDQWLERNGWRKT